VSNEAANGTTNFKANSPANWTTQFTTNRPPDTATILSAYSSANGPAH
jgi:hypothetical protein